MSAAPPQHDSAPPLAPHESLQVSEGRWQDAQVFERQVWLDSNRRNGFLKLAKRVAKAMLRPRDLARMIEYRDFYCGDDWNFWWLDAFDEYRMLPRSIDRALEVGSGPYSNVRLIAQRVAIGHITVCDPLMDEYQTFRWTWVADQARRGTIRAVNAKGESLPFDRGEFGLVVCNNVLDHVQDLELCLDEMHRVLAPGGHLVLGQELTDARDFALEEVRTDVGHPIKMEHGTLDQLLDDRYEPVFKRVLAREQGRNPAAHYGTYLLVGRKR